jgi:hypothetical protein
MAHLAARAPAPCPHLPLPASSRPRPMNTTACHPAIRRPVHRTEPAPEPPVRAVPSLWGDRRSGRAQRCRAAGGDLPR